MRWREPLPLPLLLVPLIALAACEPDATGPDLQPEVREAPGGKKGKPGDGGGSSSPALVEYFAYAGGDGTDYVHIVTDGPTEAVGLHPVLDHFHNGLRDDDPPHDQHYEYFLPGPRADEVPEALDDGRYHVDVPFRGEYNAWDDGEQVVRTAFDRPYLNVLGGSGDPFVFYVAWAWAGDQSTSQVTLGTIGDNTTGLHDHLQPEHMRPYAVLAGGDPAPASVSVESVTLTSAACIVETVTTGKGKNRETSTVVRIEAEAGFALTSQALDFDGAWTEFHLYETSTGALSSRRTSNGTGWSGSITLELSEGAEPEAVRFAVDFVHPDPDRGVYDPSGNGAWTTSGPDPAGAVFDGISDVGDGAPFAWSDEVVEVDCSS